MTIQSTNPKLKAANRKCLCAATTPTLTITRTTSQQKKSPSTAHPNQSVHRCSIAEHGLPWPVARLLSGAAIEPGTCTASTRLTSASFSGLRWRYGAGITFFQIYALIGSFAQESPSPGSICRIRQTSKQTQ
jgi:hypothetical protein